MRQQHQHCPSSSLFSLTLCLQTFLFCICLLAHLFNSGELKHFTTRVLIFHSGQRRFYPSSDVPWSSFKSDYKVLFGLRLLWRFWSWGALVSFERV